MASVEKLASGKYRARWRTPAGDSRTKVFKLKGDAERYAQTLERWNVDGAKYIDPQRRSNVVRDMGRAVAGDTGLSASIECRPRPAISAQPCNAYFRALRTRPDQPSDGGRMGGRTRPETCSGHGSQGSPDHGQDHAVRRRRGASCQLAM